MVRHEILGGLVQLYKRDDSRYWQASCQVRSLALGAGIVKLLTPRLTSAAILCGIIQLAQPQRDADQALYEWLQGAN
jgi:hypothetical protein